MSGERLKNPDANLEPDSFRWPGLPLLIAAFMGNWPNHALILSRVQYVNIAAGTATLLLIGFVAVMVFPAWGAISVVLLTAISPHLLSLTVYLLTETPAAFFVALLLRICAAERFYSPERRSLALVALGVAIGMLALFRPLFLAFVPLVALAVGQDRLKSLGFVLIGVAIPVAPWLVRNILANIPASSPSSLAMTIITGAYPNYMFNGDPATFPFPQLHDPSFAKISANVPTAVGEVLRRIAVDPRAMLEWYLLRKPFYLWQFDNIDGLGGVFVYPIKTTPFATDVVFFVAHEVMYHLHWAIVAIGAAGSLLIWLPSISVLLPASRGLALRTASLLLIFLTVSTFPLNNPVRFAVPVFPALFLMAMVPPIVLVRWIRRARMR